jgi:hypothetical protein
MKSMMSKEYVKKEMSPVKMRAARLRALMRHETKEKKKGC